jgi:GDP/UDP-N,N'-diacetylbacillosamine 2-epimerase (hydrolysing)
MKKICVVTGTRAEYGLLRWVMEGLRRSHDLQLQLVVTGAHLSPEFGMTVDAIESDGFAIDRKIEMLMSSDTAVGVTKSMGVGLIGFAEALDSLKPDLLLVLGDRYEIFAATVSAMIGGIPIAHLHGGELTEGVIDDAIRHCITKMSHLHFVATEEYRSRVLQLGENPDRVFNVGGMGVDSILHLKPLCRDDLSAAIDFKFAERNLLITFHPVTLEPDNSVRQMEELLAALSELVDTGMIFTMPNADSGARVLLRQLEDFCAKHQRARLYNSLGQLRYISCIHHVDGVVGNSSSGLTEVPTLKKGTINIGDRQRGRLRAKSIIDCEPDRKSISEALKLLYSDEFQARLQTVVNPYGLGGASDAILGILEKTSIDGLLRKGFNDLF